MSEPIIIIKMRFINYKKLCKYIRVKTLLSPASLGLHMIDVWSVEVDRILLSYCSSDAFCKKWQLKLMHHAKFN